MPIFVFDEKSVLNEKGSKLDTSPFDQKSFLRTNCNESKIEEIIDMKKFFRIESLPCPVEKTDAVCNFHVETVLSHPSIVRNTHMLTSTIKISVLFVLLM